MKRILNHLRVAIVAVLFIILMPIIVIVLIGLALFFFRKDCQEELINKHIELNAF